MTTMRVYNKLTGLMAALALGSSSCATLIYGRGPQQTISVATDPPGVMPAPLLD
jgi:hypothetical protein